MIVYEVVTCDEYEWEGSGSLYISKKRLREDYKDYTVEIPYNPNIVILCRPEFESEVRRALNKRTPSNHRFWWYELNERQFYYSEIFIGILSLEVKE